MSSLQKNLSSGKLVFTAEISPPKGPGIKKLKENIQLVAPYVSAINITDCQRAIVRMASWAACKVILDLGSEPVLQVTCRDRNSIALQSDLMGAHALGIKNVLCLTGDPVKVGDSPESKSVFELEAIKLLQLASKLQKGQDGSNTKMNSPTRFFMGAVVNPTLGASQGQLERMRKKIEAGASFFQTQANYDLADFKSFLNAAAPLKAPILAGILILHSAEIAQYIHENIPGIQLPQETLVRMKSAQNPEEEGIQIALELMNGLKSYVAGFHLMTIRKEHLIPKLLKGFHG